MAAKQRITELSAVQLVEYLDKTYPPRCIGADETVEHAHRVAGARELIDTLIMRIEREEQDGITTQSTL